MGALVELPKHSGAKSLQKVSNILDHLDLNAILLSFDYIIMNSTTHFLCGKLVDHCLNPK
jgi:hypothetical protein